MVGLTPKWRHGRATVARGRIEFILYLPTGIRMRRPWGKPIVLLVEHVEEGERQPALPELWSLNAGTDVVRLRIAGGAAVEWAVQGFQSEWAVAQTSP